MTTPAAHPRFAEALRALFGDAAGAAPQPATNNATNNNASNANTSNAQAQPQRPAPTTNVNELINRAAQDLADYQRLTAEGKLGEAGQKLESLKRTLDELQKAKQ